MADLKRIIISLPYNLLQEIDYAVSQEKCSRSEFIREAMRLYLEDKRKREVKEQMKNGYLAMAKINLELAEEFLAVEDRSQCKYESYILQNSKYVLESEECGG
ncbi:MAG: CopG family ribbon-helix-helix protein [bacterium]